MSTRNERAALIRVIRRLPNPNGWNRSRTNSMCRKIARL